MGELRFHLWSAWQRARYYWPQAKARRRAEEAFRLYYAEHGIEGKRSRPWWMP